ncbi:MAG: hypothetical protein OSB10_04380 [Planctomycetota bacterium]|nr:hypothetical protein [Planctomycetota bacterium]
MTEWAFEDLASLEAEHFPNHKHVLRDADAGETQVQTTLLRNI